MKYRLTERHWTFRDPKAAAFLIGFNFIAQLEGYMRTGQRVSRSQLARKLRVDKSRISQAFNNPNNLSVLTAVKLATALGKKVSLVAYDDDDTKGKLGHVNSAIFEECWVARGKPVDFGTAKTRASR